MSSMNFDSNSIVAKKPLEALLVGSSSSDPHSTVVVDPRTGVSVWSYKGSELQGACSGLVEPLGQSGEHIIITTKERPILHVIGVHNRDRFHQKTVVAGSASAICTSKDGRLVFVGIRKQIFVWLLTSGELLSVTDAHYQDISRLALSEDQSIIFSASLDGSVHAYLVSELVSVDRDHVVAPIRKWASHTLAVTSLSVSSGTNPRVLSCGLDHVACVHSVSLDQTILKVSSDRPLTSCAMDPAETRIFLGTDLGNIAQIDLYRVGTERDILIQTSDESNRRIRIFNGHSEEITRLAINTDGSLLASGDSSGRYCIWDIGSHQCLKVGSMRSSVASLRFIPFWPMLTGAEYTVQASSRPNWTLHRDPTKLTDVAVEVSQKFAYNSEVDFNEFIDENVVRLLRELGSTGELSNSVGNGSIESKDQVSRVAEEEVIVIDETNEDQPPPIGSKKHKRKRKNKANAVKREEDVDIIVVDKVVAPTTSSNASSAIQASNSSADAEELEQLRKEVAKLKQINKQLYEFAAKELVNGHDK